jgi:hypothetical protein
MAHVLCVHLREKAMEVKKKALAEGNRIEAETFDLYALNFKLLDNMVEQFQECLKYYEEKETPDAK